jgi:hypothetical protein
VDVESGIILNADILPGDAPDDLDALKQIEAAEENAACIGVSIAESIGDCAYGSGATRQKFLDAGRVLIGKVPSASTNKGLFPKSRFELQMVEGVAVSATCPGGQTSTWHGEDKDGGKTFYFGEHCGDCNLQPQCTTAMVGRSLRIHPQESLLQKARLYQNSEAGLQKLRKRLTVENSLARVAAYGIGQARYIGRAKSRFQLTMACCTANLRRAWNHAACKTTKNGVITALPCGA